MKITFQLPNGYRSDMEHARETGTFNDWVDGKFGTRIRELISDDFTMTIEAGSFTVDFVYEDDGREFLKLFGGRAHGDE